MSIYPVRLKAWFPKEDESHDNMKFALWFQSCLHCGKKKMHWQDAWADHSLPWGYGGAWCREKCMKNYYKKLRRPKKEIRRKVQL